MTEPFFVVATLWEHILPIDRGERYEDPLDDALSKENLGEVCGGGSMMSEDGSIEFVDIELELKELERGLSVARDVLERRGAPKGSVLKVSQGEKQTTVTFGIAECLAVFIDGVGLPDEVYENADIDALAAQIEEVLEKRDLGEIRGSHMGPTETSILIYGLDAEELFTALKPVLDSDPLLQNARVVVRHGKGSAEHNPRTVRMPMHQ